MSWRIWYLSLSKSQWAYFQQLRYVLVHDLWQGLSALDTPNSLNHFVNLPNTKAWCYIILTSTNFVMTYLHISDTVVMWRGGIYFFSSTLTSCIFTVIGSTQLGWSWSSIRQHCNLFSHRYFFLSLFTMGGKKTVCEERPCNSAATPDP